MGLPFFLGTGLPSCAPCVQGSFALTEKQNFIQTDMILVHGIKSWVVPKNIREIWKFALSSSYAESLLNFNPRSHPICNQAFTITLGAAYPPRTQIIPHPHLTWDQSGQEKKVFFSDKRTFTETKCTRILYSPWARRLVGIIWGNNPNGDF